MLSRRQFLLNILAGMIAAASSGHALAEKGSGGGGDGGGGDGGGNSGSGNNNHDDHDNDHDDDDNEKEDHEQYDAHDAVSRGDATKLRDILRKVKNRYPGEVVHVGLKTSSQRLVYMIKLIDPAGKLMMLRVDAKSGNIFSEHGS